MNILNCLIGLHMIIGIAFLIAFISVVEEFITLCREKGYKPNSKAEKCNPLKVLLSVVHVILFAFMPVLNIFILYQYSIKREQIINELVENAIK